YDGGCASSAGAAQGGGEDLLAVVLGQAAPDAVGLAHLERVLAALLDDGALGAHGLGRLVAAAPGAAPLALGVEEEVGVGLAALALVPPLPEVHDRSGKPAELCHRRTPSHPWCATSVPRGQ